MPGTDTGKWETVVNKKKSQVKKGDIQKAQQKFLDGENTPKVEVKDPIPLDQNMFGNTEERLPSRMAFDPDKERQDEKILQAESKSPRNHRRKEKKKPVAPVYDVAAEIKQLDAGSLQILIDDIKAKFSNNALIWLKEAASWLHLKLSGPAEKDLAYLNQANDYPVCYLTAEVRNILTDLLHSCSAAEAGSFLVFLAASLVSKIQLGHSTIADRILTQLLAKSHSAVFKDKYQEIVQGKSLNSDAYLAVMWLFGQYTADLTVGFEIWWTAMFPTLKSKQHATPAVRYLEKLFRVHSKVSVGTKVMSQEQLVQILSVMYSSRSPLQHSPQLQEDLQNIYPQLSALFLTERTIKKSFADLLQALKTEEDPEMRVPYCTVLAQCLLESSDCMEWWIDNLVHNLKPSKFLLQYIHDDLDNFCKLIKDGGNYKYRNVMGHASYCMLQNMEKANEKGKFEKKSGFKDCRNICLNMIRQQEKAKKSRWTIKSVLKIFLVLLLTGVAVDVYKHGSWSASKTGQFAKEKGIEDRAKVVFAHAQDGFDKVSSFCGQHFPGAYEKVNSVMGPAMDKSWEGIVVASKFIHEKSKPVIEYIHVVVPPLLEKITDAIAYCYTTTLTFIIKGWNTYSPVVVEYATLSYKWMLENIPKYYAYVVEMLTELCTKIYSLNPDFFDKCAVVANDAWNYVLKMTPIVVEKAVEIASTTANITQQYIQQCKSWIQANVATAPPSTK